VCWSMSLPRFRTTHIYMKKLRRSCMLVISTRAPH
jgi:hypothetical protein